MKYVVLAFSRERKKNIADLLVFLMLRQVTQNMQTNF